MYTRGAAADYDRWAELVDDDTWSWKNALERFKMVSMTKGLRYDEYDTDIVEFPQQIETQHDPPQHVKQYVDLEHSTHGQSGYGECCVLFTSYIITIVIDQFN